MDQEIYKKALVYMKIEGMVLFTLQFKDRNLSRNNICEILIENGIEAPNLHQQVSSAIMKLKKSGKLYSLKGERGERGERGNVYALMDWKYLTSSSPITN